MQGADVYSHYTVHSSDNPMDLKPFSSAWDSSLGASTQNEGYPAKKRNITRACDACRRRKSKCDGPSMPDNVCTNCIQTRKTCTYLETSRPRGPPKAYVTGLEDRLEKLESLLETLQPNVDFSDELGSPVMRDSWKTSDIYSDYRSTTRRERSIFYTEMPATPSGLSRKRSLSFTPTSGQASTSQPTLQAGPSTLVRSTHLLFDDQNQPKSSRANPVSAEDSFDAENQDSSSDFYSGSDSEDAESPSRGLQRLTLRGAEIISDDDPNKFRYHGHSSSLKFAEAAKKFKERHLKPSASPVKERAPLPQQAYALGSPTKPDAGKHPLRRQEFWFSPSWELEFEGVTDDSVQFLTTFDPSLPPPDLVRHLLDIYFLHVNTQFPLLHRPTFEKHWKDDLFHRDVWFACLCFSLFAVASRWSNDRRVLLDQVAGPQEDNDAWKLAGARYLKCAMEITRMKRSLFHPSCLFEVQSLYLQASYMRGTVHYPVAWLFVSIAIRKSQDLGAHRRSLYKDSPTVEGELWKRAFWLLVVMDRMGSASLGRACVLAEEDFDIDLPLEVDDEYWDTGDPSAAFKQPPDVPSRVTFLNMWIKLSQVVSFALKTVYAANKPKMFSGVHIPGWRQEVLKQLNSAMEEFASSIPSHLQWSPSIRDPIFANQSVSLYTTYYMTQILIYRPFLAAISSSPPTSGSASPNRDSPALALAICTQAARSCARILEDQMPKGVSSVQNLINASHICAASLSVKVWDIKKGEQGLSAVSTAPLQPGQPEPSIPELMSDINFFISALQWAESRWEIASYFLHMIRGSLPSSDEEGKAALPPIPNQPSIAAHQPSRSERASLPRISTFGRPQSSIRTPLNDPDDIRQWQSAHSSRLFTPPTLIRLSPQVPGVVQPPKPQSEVTSPLAHQAYPIDELAHQSQSRYVSTLPPPQPLPLHQFTPTTPSSGNNFAETWRIYPPPQPDVAYLNYNVVPPVPGVPPPLAPNSGSRPDARGTRGAQT
ncbi:hypothetical protein HGRIS_002685 [Hohenbuehelia grisea]